MPDVEHEIRGGAGADVAAAIGALIAYLLDEEAATKATPSRRPRQSPWVLAWRPRDVPAALPSHTFDAPGWSEAAEPEDG